MLQISQIEKPRCSATIDQMRLRRAMNLPLDSQYFSFSGSQSEIQVVFRSLMRDFPFWNDARSSRAAVGQKKGRPQRRSKASFRAAALPVRSISPTRVPSTVTDRNCSALQALCQLRLRDKKSRKYQIVMGHIRQQDRRSAKLHLPA